MRTKSFGSLASIAFAFALAAMAASVSAQSVSTNAAGGTQTRTDKSIEYHNGSVLTGTQFVYFIWYGDWSANVYSQIVLSDFISTLGSTPYFETNTGYPNTYTVTNPAGQLAEANIKLGYRHYLLQQNSVNGKKGHCAMSLAQ